MRQFGIQSGSNTIQPLNVDRLAQYFIEDTGSDTAMKISGPTLILFTGGKLGSNSFPISLKLQL